MANAAVFRQTLRVFTEAHLSPAARSARLATVAIAALKELQAAGRAPPGYARFVDGRAGAMESTVRGDGTGRILYQFSPLTDAAVFALKFLRARAPKGAGKSGKFGKFRDSFYVGVNGKFIPAAQFKPKSVPADAEIVIGNTRPYNRKVDVQRNGVVVLRYNTPPEMYKDCVVALRQRFGNSLLTKRVYDMDFPGKYILKVDQKTKAGKIKRAAGDSGQSPAIIIKAVA